MFILFVPELIVAARFKHNPPKQTDGECDGAGL